VSLHRIEKDTFGPIEVPAERLWGAQTQRSLQNFKIGGDRMPAGLIRALAQVKRASAKVNVDLGQLANEKGTAIMQAAVTYVWTHDSIGLGEDGPTHQPVEHLAALRAMPGLAIVRPADANETAQAWAEILRRRQPVGLALSRQNLPVLDRTRLADPALTARGGYVLAEASSGSPAVLLLATGSEVALALNARETLEADGVPTRVVSLPCLEWFDEQDDGYKEQVLPPGVRARVSVEAGVAQPWYRYVGDAGRCVSLEHFGGSADQATLYREFGLTSDAVVEAARASLAATR